jgi:signal transduction histidine kinase/CheY-like chemotaxis protein
MLHTLRSGSLRGRLTVMNVVLVTTVVLSISGYFIYRLDALLSAEVESKADVVRHGLEAKGMALAHNTALAAETALQSRYFFFLQQIIAAAVKDDPQMRYGLIMDKALNVLVHSDADRAGRLANDPAAKRASDKEQPSFEIVEAQGEDVIDASAPIFVSGARWGTVRFGLSLQALRDDTRASLALKRSQLERNVLATLGLACCLLLFGSGLGALVASKLLVPLDALKDVAQRVAAGEHAVGDDTLGSPEFVALTSGFNEMVGAVQARERELSLALDEAREANRLKSEFLANVSHELRTPLNAIVNVPSALLEDFKSVPVWKCKGCAGLFQMEVGDPSVPGACPECGAPVEFTETYVFLGEPGRHLHLLTLSAKSARHLLSVVNDILDFSKLEAGEMRLELANIDYEELLVSLRGIMQTAADEKHITLRTSVGVGLSRLVADSTKLGQILGNLVGNAIKFTPEGGKVDVTIEPAPDGGALFSVVDTGPGIAKEDHEIIFESFRQADGSHTRIHGGTGLGLAITRDLVHLHGGRVWLESEPGHGAAFRFALPPVAAGVSPQMASVATRAPGGSAAEPLGSVVVIDDDTVFNDLLHHILPRHGFSVVSLDSVLERLPEQIHSIAPDAVLLDIMMPHVSGLSVLKQLKDNPATAEIPIIVCSAHTSNRDIVLNAGGLWVQKPVDIHQVLDKLRLLHSEHTKEGGVHGA